MHSFKKLALGLSALALVAPTLAEMTAGDIVANINVITDQSAALQDPANNLGPFDAILSVYNAGNFPILLSGFENIVATVQNDIDGLAGTQPFTLQSDEDAIVDALTNFVLVHQALLNIIIGKTGILQQIPLVGPIVATTLQAVEAIVDGLAGALIGLIPDSSDAAQTQVGSLDQTIQQAIDAFSGGVNIGF